MLKNIKNRHFFLVDLLLLALTPTIALSLRLQVPWDDRFTPPLLLYTLLSLIVKLVIFYVSGLYRQFWRYASVDSLLTILWSVGVSSVVITGLVFVLYGTGLLSSPSIPRSIPLIDSMLTLIVVGGTRLSLRVIEHQSGGGSGPTEGKRILVAGAGDAGEIVAREILHSRHVQDHLVGFLDDDPAKLGMIIHGVQVMGKIDQLPEIVEREEIDEVIIAMPTVPGAVIRKIVQLAEQSLVSVKTLPGIFELLSGEVSVSRLRPVQIGDLLRRDPVVVPPDQVEQLLQGKRVLVTGAGGSIGAELCEQIVQCWPSQLVALGHGENSLYRLPRRLSYWDKLQREQRLELVVADIRDASRIDSVFAHYQPEVVYHAAAHKHVPLMEQNIEDAITNNIEGTYNLVRLCGQHEVSQFVLISTDKAVEPVSVMGMTKYIAERIVQQAARQWSGCFVTVRFGNVLGSRGSVVPLFQRQIQAGGPVTVTHPEMKRFFMTIQEAVQLVLQASAMGTNGEVFVLDMGEQVRIIDLARDLIRLSGLTEGEDVEIRFTGIRPGEKLSESLYTTAEQPRRTAHEKILVIPGRAEIDERFLETLERLIGLARQGKPAEAHTLLEALSVRGEPAS